MSERRSQERDRETVSRDKENIGRHRLGAGAACSLSVSLTPGLGTEGTIPRLATGWNKGEQRQKLDTARHRGERESYTTCADISRTQTTIGKFSGNYSECISAISVWPILVMSGRAGQWFPPPACEQCRLQGQRKYKVAMSLGLVTRRWRHSGNKPCSRSG